jgi:hypothetical protein
VGGLSPCLFWSIVAVDEKLKRFAEQPPSFCIYANASCDRKTISRGLCDKHYRQAKANDELPIYNKQDKRQRTRICNLEDCKNKYYGRGYCKLHYGRFIVPTHAPRLAAWHQRTKDLPERQDQKRKAQSKYHKTIKGRITFLRNWAAKKGKTVEISEEFIEHFDHLPCCYCGKARKTYGSNFYLEPRTRKITPDTMIACCNLCKAEKAQAPFNKFAWAKALLRRFWRRIPSARVALLKANRGRGLYECAECHKIFKKKQIQLDHRIPVIDPVEGYKNLDTYVDRLYCDESNLQVLCTKDHSEKTIAEHKIRQENK